MIKEHIVLNSCQSVAINIRIGMSTKMFFIELQICSCVKTIHLILYWSNQHSNSRNSASKCFFFFNDFASIQKSTFVSTHILIITVIIQYEVWFYRYKIFKPKIRLLTEEEYQQQGLEETKKALEELRSFCQSPECKPWKTISRLRSPNRSV